MSTERRMTSLWMGDLEPYMDEQFITNAFLSMSEQILAVKLIKNKITGGPAGYCFVDFPSSDAANKALMRLNGKPMPGTNPNRRFKLNYSNYGRDSQHQEHSVFVGDLSPEVDDAALYSFFQRRYPTCKGARVVLDSAGNSRGYGFVRFASEQEQTSAMSEMQGAIGLGSKPIRVSIATPRNRRNDGGSYGQTGGGGGVGGGSSGYYQSGPQQQYQGYQDYYGGAGGWGGGWQQSGSSTGDGSNAYYAGDFASGYQGQGYTPSASVDQNQADLEDPCPAINIDQWNSNLFHSSEKHPQMYQYEYE